MFLEDSPHVPDMGFHQPERVGYDPNTEVLLVVFRDRSAYRYFGVPNAIFENFQTAPSKGTYFNRVIRGAYGFQVARVEA
jgi:lysyl-tRNA synthetase, class II